jgi:hypothetical protein
VQDSSGWVIDAVRADLRRITAANETVIGEGGAFAADKLGGILKGLAHESFEPKARQRPASASQLGSRS